MVLEVELSQGCRAWMSSDFTCWAILLISLGRVLALFPRLDLAAWVKVIILLILWGGWNSRSNQYPVHAHKIWVSPGYVRFGKPTFYLLGIFLSINGFLKHTAVFNTSVKGKMCWKYCHIRINTKGKVILDLQLSQVLYIWASKSFMVCD